MGVGGRQKWLPGGEVFENWQGSLGALPRDGRRQEGGNWVQVTTEQQLGQGVGEAGLVGAWSAAPQLGLQGEGGLLSLLRPGKAPSSQATGWEGGHSCELRPTGLSLSSPRALPGYSGATEGEEQSPTPVLQLLPRGPSSA